MVGRLLPTERGERGEVVPLDLESINWSERKSPERNLDKCARRLEVALGKAEWFVTGLVQPKLFSDDFVFKDPDVTLSGVRAYAVGVRKLFDQKSSRAEIARVRVRRPSTIEIAWRLSGGVQLGPVFLSLKPYVVITDLFVDEQGLVVYQEDRFSIPSWDILLSAVLPFLRPFLAPEAPAIEELRLKLAAEPE